MKFKMEAKKGTRALLLPLAKKLLVKVMIADLIFQTIVVIVSIAMGYGKLNSYNFPIVAGLGFGICVFFHPVVLLMSLSTMTQNIADEIDLFYVAESSEKDRLKLMKLLGTLPSNVAANVFISSCVLDGAWLFLFVKLAGLDLSSIILIIAVMYFGIYSNCAYLIAYAVRKVSSPHAAEVVKKGIPKSIIESKQAFGQPAIFLVILLIFCPIFLISLMLFVFAWRAYASYTSQSIVFFKLVWFGIIAVGAYAFFATLLFKRMVKSVADMKNLLSGINQVNIHSVKKAKTDLSNEFMFNVYHINKIIEILQKILKKSQDISLEVIESSNELSVISSETAVTSQEQNSSVKNLLSAMEETDELSKNIAEKIGEVSLVAKKTSDNISDGFEILKQNMQKLEEIKNANDVTVDGIKKLTEKISGISDIARIINGIADQTNLIAFNAEIEASSAGEVGENFALVANEIRRLTNSTIQSTNEIRNRIVEIQHSSSILLASSQTGSNKIVDETQIISKLNDRFVELQHSSESMDYASEEIKNIIDQQVAAFAQIVVTLRQITASSDLFSNSIQKISESAQNLCIISDELKRFQPEEKQEESQTVNASEVE